MAVREHPNGTVSVLRLERHVPAVFEVHQQRLVIPVRIPFCPPAVLLLVWLLVWLGPVTDPSPALRPRPLRVAEVAGQGKARQKRM